MEGNRTLTKKLTQDTLRKEQIKSIRPRKKKKNEVEAKEAFICFKSEQVAFHAMEDIKENQVTWIASIAYSNKLDREKNSEKKRSEGEPSRNQARRNGDPNFNESSFNSL